MTTPRDVGNDILRAIKDLRGDMEQGFTKVNNRIDGLSGTVNEIERDFRLVKGFVAENEARVRVQAIAAKCDATYRRQLDFTELRTMVQKFKGGPIQGEAESFCHADLVIESLDSDRLATEIHGEEVPCCRC